MHSSELRSVTIPTTRFGEGYDMSEVDALLDHCVATLETLERGGGIDAAAPDGIAQAQLRTTRFREGYVTEAVDDVLDVVVASIRTHLGG